MARPKNEAATDHIQDMISSHRVASVFSAADIEASWYKGNPKAPAPVARVTIIARLKELVRAGILEKIGNCYQRKEGNQ